MARRLRWVLSDAAFVWFYRSATGRRWYPRRVRLGKFDKLRVGVKV